MAFLVAAYLWFARKNSLGSGAFAVVGLILFFIAAFHTWEKEHDRAENLEKQREIPKLFLNYKSEKSFHPDRHVFFVQTEDDNNAFDVEINSEETVTTDHRRMFMDWQVPKCPVGKNPVPVKAMCRQYRGGKDQIANTYSLPDQILEFFKSKKGKNELIVTVTFKDLEGKECPPKKFLITSRRDVFGHFEIGIGPIGPQAAS